MKEFSCGKNLFCFARRKKKVVVKYNYYFPSLTVEIISKAKVITLKLDEFLLEENLNLIIYHNILKLISHDCIGSFNLDAIYIYETLLKKNILYKAMYSYFVKNFGISLDCYHSIKSYALKVARKESRDYLYKAFKSQDDEKLLNLATDFEERYHNYKTENEEQNLYIFDLCIEEFEKSID